jgi:medium-chain acyl-[acyl-carrier-protein] hydrolase
MYMPAPANIGACSLAGEDAFDFPITTYSGSRDRKIDADMVSRWQRFTTASFSCSQIQGHHLWPLDKAAKQDWLLRIVAELSLL